MAYATFTQSFGAGYANAYVLISEASTGLPATIMAATTGGVVSTQGQAQLDGNGNLSVVIDTARTWNIEVYQSGGTTGNFFFLTGVGTTSTQKSFAVPAGVSRLNVWMVGGGGGGGGSAASGSFGAGGGGGGVAVFGVKLAVTPGQILYLQAGGGGAGGLVTAAGVAGAASYIRTASQSDTPLLLVAGGALGAASAAGTAGAGGTGGGVTGTGGAAGTTAAGGAAAAWLGITYASSFVLDGAVFPGAGGGGGGGTNGGTGGAGGASGANTTPLYLISATPGGAAAGANGGGGSGGSSVSNLIFGLPTATYAVGTGGAGNAPGVTATQYGFGGGGAGGTTATGKVGGAGAPGLIMMNW